MYKYIYNYDKLALLDRVLPQSYLQIDKQTMWVSISHMYS